MNADLVCSINPFPLERTRTGKPLQINQGQKKEGETDEIAQHAMCNGKRKESLVS